MLSLLSVYFIHTSPRVLQPFLNPPNMTSAIIFITYVAAMLRVVLGFQFIYTQSKMSLFSEVKWPVSWEDITGPAHIAVSCQPHKYLSGVELLHVQDIPS